MMNKEGYKVITKYYKTLGTVVKAAGWFLFSKKKKGDPHEQRDGDRKTS